MADIANTRANEVYKFARTIAIDRKSVNTSGNEQYEQRLRKTVERLEAQLRAEQQKLNDKRAKVDKSLQISLDQATDPSELLRQRKVITAAYKKLANSKPDLPGKDSVLPRLIALQAVSQITSETRSILPQAQASLKSARKNLAAESQRLAAFTILKDALEERLVELDTEAERQQRLSAEEIARERVAELRAREGGLHEEANALGSELRWFVREYLAPMLAVEKVGGPPVGDIVEVTDEMLGTGFSESTGKPKQAKGDPSELAQKGREIRRETKNEVRKLFQDLLNAATGDGDDEGWVELPENSKPAQFLITARVAMFHPKDARKIQLLDFSG